MSSDGGFTFDGTAGVSARWAELATDMAATHRELDRASASGVPPSAAAAATAFLQAWATYAEESASMASGFGQGLQQVATTYSVNDAQVADGMRKLNARLGPGL